MLWIASVTSWSYETLAQMPILQLEEWHEHVLAFHQERLSEQEPIEREPQGASRVPKERPLSDFF